MDFKNIKRENDILILDGAMGSLLHQKGIIPHKTLWTSIANLTHKDLVKNIHKEYIDAGADIITTNTFRTFPVAVKNTNYTSKDLVNSAISLAKEVIKNKKILLAGSNPPAEDSYQKERNITLSDLEYNHKKHIELLYENGVDFILNETQSHLDEINIIARFCYSNKIPFIISLFLDEELKVLSGEPLGEIIGLICS